MYRLAIDIGNTRTKMGVYNHGDLVEFKLVEKLSIDNIKEFIKKYSILGCGVCASGVIDNQVQEFLSKEFRAIFLSHETKIPINILYETPHTLGRDRIAASIGAWKWFKSQNTLIVNMGTCITMDVLDASGTFLGGNISPGIQMRLKAMHEFTAKLPLVEGLVPIDLLGSNTTKAMQNGGVKGAFYEVESFIEKLTEKYSQLNVVLSGGDAPLFEKYTKSNIFARPYIVLDGLIEVLINNNEH